MIEIKKAGEVCVLMLRRESSAWDPPAQVYQQARPEDVANAVDAGDPKITGRLRELGWRKVPVESKTMAEAGANLVHESTALLMALRGWDSALVGLARENLQAAINSYTANVAPPDECKHEWIGDSNECRKCGGPETDKLRSRAVLPDELDEDPELDADETDRQLYAIKSHHMTTKEQMRDLRDAVRALIVCLDSDTSDELQDPVKMVERLGELRIRGIHADAVIVDDPLVQNLKELDPKLAEAGYPAVPEIDYFGTRSKVTFRDHLAAGAFWVLDRLWPS